MAAVTCWVIIFLSVVALHDAVLGSEDTEQVFPNASLSQPDEHKVNFEEAVKFYLLTRDQPSGIEVDLSEESLQSKGFDKSLSSTIIIHGYGQNITAKVIKAVGGALVRSGSPTNVLAVDWGDLCPKPFYLTSRSRVAPVGERVAALIAYLVDSGLGRHEDIHLIGHSLGAHVAGNAGKVSKAKVARITGLDPAGPLFFESSSDRLSSADAELVDVIHTCIGVLGYKKPVGHVDFYPNGGRISQPGCGVVDDVLQLGHCSHARSYELFAESILDGSAFPAIKCGTYEDAMDKKCDAKGNSQIAYMGYQLRFAEPGVYFLKTAASFPFGLGLNSN